MIITLTQGQVAEVDAEDFPRISQHKWYACWFPGTRSFYAMRRKTVGAKKQIGILLHREILGLEKGDIRLGDHIDGNTLNNSRGNLRIATPSQNCRNQKIRINNKSGYKGVSWRKDTEKWAAYINFDGKKNHLGFFSTPEQAHAAYCSAAAKHHGEFARFDSNEVRL